jgi:hypothetical protein
MRKEVLANLRPSSPSLPKRRTSGGPNDRTVPPHTHTRGRALVQMVCKRVIKGKEQIRTNQVVHLQEQDDCFCFVCSLLRHNSSAPNGRRGRPPNVSLNRTPSLLPQPYHSLSSPYPFSCPRVCFSLLFPVHSSTLKPSAALVGRPGPPVQATTSTTPSTPLPLVTATPQATLLLSCMQCPQLDLK